MNLMKSLQALSRSRIVFHGQGSLQLSSARFGTVRPMSPNPRNCQQILLRHTNIAQARFYSKPIEAKEATAVKGTVSGVDTSQGHLRTKAPTDWEKKVLVWYGKYSTVEDVPPFVTSTVLNAAMNKFRVATNIFLVFATFLSTMVMIYLGRRRAGRGESVSTSNMQRHPEQYEQNLDNKNTNGK